ERTRSFRLHLHPNHLQACTPRVLHRRFGSSPVDGGGGLVVRRSAGRPACVPLPQDVSPLHEQCRGWTAGRGFSSARGTPARARGSRVASPVDLRRPAGRSEHRRMTSPPPPTEPCAPLPFDYALRLRRCAPTLRV